MKNGESRRRTKEVSKVAPEAPPKMAPFQTTVTPPAEYLGVTQNTMRKWAARGDMPMHRNPANGYGLFKRTRNGFFYAQAHDPE